MIFQVRIELQLIEPVIWRRLYVHSEFYLSQFHDVIQVAMGWTNSHLHQFIKGDTFFTKKIEGDLFWDEMNNVDYENLKISDLLSKPGDTIEYEYDFGDSWLHTITLEEIYPETAGLIVPFCISGERASPPEDCGGPFDYMNLHNSKSGKRDTVKEGHFDPKDINELFSPTLLTYKQLLLGATKNDIINIAYFLGIKIKTNLRKEQLANDVEEALLTNPLLIKNALSYKEISLLNSIYNHKDTHPVLEMPELQALIFLRLVYLQESFSDSGIFKFPDKLNRSIVPRLQEILDDSSFKQNCEIEDLIIGLVTLYGVLSLSKVSELITKHKSIIIETTDILGIIAGSIRMVDRVHITSYSNTTIIYYPMIDSPIAMIREINNRNNIQYKEFTTQEILDAAGDLFYFDVNNAYANLRKLICKQNIQDPDFLFHNIWFILQTEESPMQVIDFLSKEITFNSLENMQTMLNALMDYSNSIPKWILKGNSSKEIFEGSKSGFKKDKATIRKDNFEQNPQVVSFFPPKIGRNDLCPCGSGKKYKHCCGNN